VREFLKKGRPVYTSNGEVGVIVGEEETLDRWLVGTISGPLKAIHADDLMPLVTIDQRISLEIEGMEPGSQLANMVKPFGMSSEDLQDFTVQFNEEAQARIKGPGNDEYTMDGHQKFEEMELDELIEYAEEEVLDLANYCAMLFIRLRRIRNALDAADDLGRGTEEEYEGGTVTADDFKEE
jgi:hypothetical protein